MTAWKVRWMYFIRNWTMIGAAHAVDHKIYPRVLLWTRDWNRLYALRKQYGRGDAPIHLVCK